MWREVSAHAKCSAAMSRREVFHEKTKSSQKERANGKRNRSDIELGADFFKERFRCSGTRVSIVSHVFELIPRRDAS